MIKLAPSTKTLICIGSGGVGKTTLAATLAVGLAFEGRKVLVLTIDPSMRLAQTLGIKLTGEQEKVNLPLEAKGQLYASVINHQKIFDWFLEQASKGQADAEGLKKNRLYQQLTGRLSGSQDFTSLVALQKAVSSEVYDLVILDTPPSQHTWNFLKAPEKISALFNDGIAKWFRQSTTNEPRLLSRFLNLGTTQVLKALETLTGSQFMQELSMFFAAIKTWQGPLESYIADSHRLLTSNQTEFLLVTALDTSRLIEAQKLSREILKQGYKLTSVMINRVYPWVQMNQVEQNSWPTQLKHINNYYQDLETELTSHFEILKKSLNIYKCPELRQNSDDVKNLAKNYSKIIHL